jgi:VIT1/CCC1 family predicted Fe2+/Mn2+ transporter
MAAGEYTSVASQAEYTRAEIEVERREISLRPAAEEAELAQMYVDRGISPELAAAMAAQIHLDPELAVEVHTREELGVDPDNLPSPMVAAGSSFVSFAVGALLPVLPYLLGAHTILPALVVSLLALFGCGALVSRVTTRSWWYGGLRQLLLGGVAAGLTFLIGELVGTAIG